MQIGSTKFIYCSILFNCINILLFINDLPEWIQDVKVSLFADDVRFAKIVRTEGDIATLQNAINRLKSWCDANRLHLNISKCAIMTFNRGKNQITTDYLYGSHTFDRVTEHKDLGVLMDAKLSFLKHLYMVSSKASAALGFLRRFCHDISDIPTLKSLYYALVQSHIEYCNIVWLPFYDVHKNKIESILKQFSMYARREFPSIANNFKITPYHQRLAELNMTSLNRRRVNTAITFLYDVIHSNSSCPSIRDAVTLNDNAQNLRRAEQIKINDRALRLSLSAPITQICKFTNQAQIDINTPNRSAFISMVKKAPDSLFGI